MPPKGKGANLTALNLIAGDLNVAATELLARGMVVENLPIQLVRPDPAQPRRILPNDLYMPLFEEQITPKDAIKELIDRARAAAVQAGRAFNSLLDFTTEEETPADLSPDEELVRDLVKLALTLSNGDQVYPLTVYDLSAGAARIYQIETGERRYWATLLLMYFMPGYNGDGTIECIVVEPKKYSPFRQAKENSSRRGLNAVAMARQAARLLLYVYSMEPPAGPVPNSWYRQALKLDMRGARDYTQEILSSMGGISAAHFSQIKSLLRLSDEALELADRHSIEERRLRPVLQLDEQYHVEAVRAIIEHNLTSDELIELLGGAEISDVLAVRMAAPKPAAKKSSDKEPTGGSGLPRAARVAAKAMSLWNKTTGQEIAAALVEQSEDLNHAKSRLQNFRTLLIEAEEVIDQLKKD